MASNSNLRGAKTAKKDEFYTQYADIQKEINAYLEYNPNLFRDKTVLLPCDDPEWSNFTKFFAQNFELLGLKKLISTSFAQESKNYKADWQPTLFETENPIFDAERTTICGKLFVLDRDINGDNRINIQDLEWQYLEGTGDFRSDEVIKLRDEADIIITNPPFSLLREFIAWLIDSGKQFSIIGNLNAISYKEIFPLIRNNRIWLGATNFNTGMYFYVPDGFQYAPTYKFEREVNGRAVNRVPGCCWYTNIEHGRRHEPISMLTMEENLTFSKHKEIKGKQYYKYINFEGIDVPKGDAIPSDYDGIMGVPISFLDKYCPEQFEIIGLANGGELGIECGVSSNLSGAECKALFKEDKTFRRGKLFYRDSNGNLIGCYARILIRKRNLS